MPRGPRDAARRCPGVNAASLFSNIPLSGGGSSSGYQARPGEVGPKETVPGNKYDVDEQAIAALGVKLIAGRPFEAHEILPPSETYEDVAAGHRDQGFREGVVPEGRELLGKTFYDGLSEPTTIVGVIEHMHGAWVGWDELDNVVLFPRVKNGPTSVYLVRTEPGRRDAVMRDIEAKLGDSNPGRLLRWVRPFDYFINAVLPRRPQHGDLPGERDERTACDHRARHLRPRDLQRQTRIRQIGTRRAVGARRMDIVRHFLVENWMVTTAGIVAGCGAALGIGYWISVKYELPRLDLYYLVGGVLAIWLIGLAAALQPARRASTISPAVASRTV